MSADPTFALITYIGTMVQLVGSMLLVVLFALLRRNMSRKSYFGMWGWAWLAETVAIAAIVMRYRLVTDFSATRWSDAAPGVQGLYVIYQTGKLVFYGCLVGGTLMYATGLRVRSYVPAAVVAALAYGVVTVALATHLTAIVVWQAPIAAASFTFCAARLLRLPPSRRTLGSEVTGTIFGLAGALWATYAGAFGFVMLGRTEHPFIELVRFNSYIDILIAVLLGFGMVVILMEDAKREADDAHAELAVAHDQLRRAALFDPVTGALNRRAFLEGVGLESAKATFGSVVMIDMDNLKMANDTCGHAAGDALLKHFVEVLRTALRPADRIYRWGGDEFLVVMQGAKALDVEPRLVETIASAPAMRFESPPVQLRLQASVGASDYRGAEDLAAAIELADRAMYRQKSDRKLSGPQAAVSVG